MAAIVVYFAIAMAGNIVDVWLNIRFCKSEGYYKNVWEHEKVKSSKLHGEGVKMVYALNSEEEIPS